jgi:membrane fusion protein, multidrug efflux system
MATALKTEHAPPPPAEAPASPAPHRATPAGSRRKVVLPIVAVVALLALGWAFQKWSYGRSHESTDNAYVKGHIIPVNAKVGGYVVAVNVDENRHVDEGALLAQIDSAEYRVRLAQAEAELAAAQAAAGSGPGTGQAEAQVAAAVGQRGAFDAQIAAARANRDKAEADLARMRELAAKQIVSQQQLDAAQAAADAASATLLSVQRQAASAGASVAGAEAGVRLAQARLASARAARDNAALQLSYTHVAAPATGLVSRKQVEVGQLVQPGQPLLSLVADTGVYVTANFKETQLSDIRVGQPVDVDVDAYGGCTARGVVESVSGATGAEFTLLPPDNATGNFTKVVQRIPVRIKVTSGCGPDRPLRPGMSVEAHVKTR